ncbi:MAG: hypothetical protein J6U01_02930 [Clostridia bacterium]|nr:hypothetical protein [Clostridia bacterium]
MNSVLAVLTALVMVFSGLAGMTSKMEAPITIESTASIQMDTVNALLDDVIEIRSAEISPEYREAYVELMQEQTQKARGILALAATLINQVSARYVVDQGYLEGGLYANGEALLNGAALADAKGITLVSSLLGNTALTLSGADAQEILKTGLEELKKLFSGLTIGGQAVTPATIPQLDPEALAAVMNEMTAEITQGIMSKMGAPEAGTFVVDDMQFAMRVPFNISEKEVKLIALKAVKKALDSEAAQKLLKAIPQAEQLTAKIDEKLAEVEVWADDQPIYAYVYTTEDQKASYFHVKRHESEMAACLGFGVIGEEMVINASSGVNHKDVRVTAVFNKDGALISAEKPMANEQKATFNMQVQGTKLNANLEIPLPTGKSVVATAVADNTGTQETVTYGGNELASQTVRILTGGKVERLTEGKTDSFDLASLLKDESGETMKTLTTKLTSGALTLMAKMMSLVGTEENAKTLVDLIPAGAFAPSSN